MEEKSRDKEVKNRLERDQLQGELPKTKIFMHSKYENGRKNIRNTGSDSNEYVPHKIHQEV
jgi:hypothetical protein